MAMLQPKPGFDWKKVTWGRPDSVVTSLCSYCSAALAGDSVPLCMWTSDDHAARFCEACQETWFGLEGFDDDED